MFVFSFVSQNELPPEFKIKKEGILSYFGESIQPSKYDLMNDQLLRDSDFNIQNKIK